MICSSKNAYETLDNCFEKNDYQSSNHNFNIVDYTIVISFITIVR